MKRILCLLLVLVMLTLAACSGSEGDLSSADGSADNASAEAESKDVAATDGIVVPDISGMSAKDAEAALKNAGFSVKVKEKPDDNVPEGEVISIDLKAGDSYKKGTRVWLYISTGKGLAGEALNPKPSALVASRPVLDVGANSDYQPVNYKTMKACWISQYDFKSVYSDGSLQYDEDKFRDNVARVFKGLWDKGINTVLVQLRPNGDSFYPSAYYCPSKYVTGSYATDFRYDPLSIMVEEAHKVGLSFHGWINPFRCMDPGDLNIINITYGVRKLAEESMGTSIIKNTDGLLWLNPGSEEARKLIVDGATEIVRYYDVDGIHIDDYFYPYNIRENKNFDKTTYESQDEYLTLDSYRFSNINKTVSALYAGVKAENPKVLFGVSPAGTPGVAANVYVDYNTWLSHDNYCDYIMPQIYWGMQLKNSFSKVYDQWKSFIKVPTIRIIPGMDMTNVTEGFAGESEYSEFNNNRNVLKNCLQYAISTGVCDGFSLFSMSGILSPNSAEYTQASAEELGNLFELADAMPDGLLGND